MKRGAEKQLSKDDGSDDEVEEVESTQGFKKAEESILATRKIRGLPKRLAGAGGASSGGLTVSAPKTEPAPAPKFAGFAGFGAPTTGSTPFSFTPSAPTPAEPKPATTITTSSPFSFGAIPSGTKPSTTTPTSAFAPSAPVVAANASSATKVFASFLGSPPSKTAEPKIPKEDKVSDSKDTFEAEKQYYTALRGLNVSFLSAVSKAIESDPFLDVAEVLEKYKNLRLSVQADFDNTKKKAQTETKPAAPAPVTSAFSFGKPSTPASNNTTSMPAPPTSTFTFGKPAKVSESSTESEFPKADPSATSKPFSFGAPPSSSADSAPAAKLPFPLSSSSTTSDSTTSAPKSAFAFGTSAMSTSSGTSAFSSGGKPPGITMLFGSSSGAPSVFSSNLFGKPSDTSKSDKEEKKDDVSPSPPPAPTSSIFGSKSSSSTPFTFGSSTPPKQSAFGGFGKSGGAGSIGNPVGFGFGSPPRTPGESDSGAPPTPSAASATTFTGFFGGTSKAGADRKSSAVPSETSAAPSDVEGTTGSGTATADEGVPPLMTVGNSQHDAEGEGEEDEETTHEIRSKVFKLVKKQDGKSDWTDMGVGVLRLKKHKETGTRRVLLRNSSTGKITINFNIYDGMTPAVKDKVVSFMGHDQGASVPYKLRTKTPQAANELKAALEREITFVKAKNEES